MTFGSYLKRPPTGDLLAIIAMAVGVHVGLGTLLWQIVPTWPWWQSYLLSATSGIAAALGLALRLHARRAR